MSSRACIAALALGLAFTGCAKKEPKPLRTEPWLAHAVPSASASSDAGLAPVRYTLEAPSAVEVTLTAERGVELNGKLSGVMGELSLEPRELARSRGNVRVELRSLTIGTRAQPSDPALTRLALQALELTDREAGSAASFELTALDDLSEPLLEPVPERAALPFKRKLQATAVGNLLLHGFRVERRVPVRVECMYESDRQLPSGLSIWSSKPFVISLETHAIEAVDPAGKRPKVVGVRANIEFHYRKID